MTCFGVNGVNPRVYYIDTENRLNELAWEGTWGNNVLTEDVVGPSNALACYGLGGAASRVYYVTKQNQVDELAWVGWAYNTLPGTL